MTVLAILLYIGGALLMAYALIGFGRAAGGASTGMAPVWGRLLAGALYVGLARALQLGLRWARRVALVLCWIGLALAMVRVFAVGPLSALAQALWPVVYLVLLTRPGVRDWFAPRPAPGDEPAGM